MLKQHLVVAVAVGLDQPPSGGCVLKPQVGYQVRLGGQSAAFGRLCVETDWWIL